MYVNGKFVPSDQPVISVFDHGFLYGDGVFEGIRAYNGRVFKLKEHVDRLFDSAKAIDLDIGMSKEEVAEAILETLRQNNLKDAYIRPIVSRGNGDLGLDPRKCEKPNVFIVAKVMAALYGGAELKGVTVAVRRNAPDALSPNIKSLNYLNNVLAKIETNAKGGQEAIFLDSNGYVAEGSADNIFVVKNGVVFTPPTINNLRGITRATAIELLEKNKIPVRVENISLFDVYTSDEIFVTGTAAEAVAVVWVDGRTIGTGKTGPVTQLMLKEFEKLTSTTGTEIYPTKKTQVKAAAKSAAKTATATVKTVAKKVTAKPAEKPAAEPAAKTAPAKKAEKSAAKKADKKPASKK